MEQLGYKLFSVLGWSDGSKVASLVAINYPARVEKLVIWGVITDVTEAHIKAVAMTSNIAVVFEPMSRERYIEAYGHELFERLWQSGIDNLVSYSGDAAAYWDIRGRLQKIMCPTLILHGNKDPLVEKEQALTAERLIPESRLVSFSTGPHNIHQVFADKFNKIVTDFLLND